MEGTESWANTAMYREVRDTLREVDRLDSVKLFLVPQAGYMVFNDDLVTLRGTLHLSVQYWKDTSVSDTEVPDALAFCLLSEAEMRSVVQAVFTVIKRRLDLFEYSNKGIFTRTRSGSPGNPYAFFELAPGLASSDTSFFAFIYIDSASDATGDTLQGIKAKNIMAESTNVYLAYTDCQSTLGACILTDSPQLSGLSALLCQLSIKEAAIVENEALESVLTEQSLMFSPGTATFRKNLALNHDVANARIRRVIFSDSEDSYMTLYAQSKSASFVTKAVITGSKPVPMQGSQLLVALLVSLLEHTHLEELAEQSQQSQQSQAASASQSLCPGTFLFEVPVLSATMLYTAADMRSLRVIDYQSSSRRTLYSLLNKTVTQHGALQLLRWLRAPLVDINTISYRHDIVQYLLTEHMGGTLYAFVHKILRSCPQFAKTGFMLRTYERARSPASILAALLDAYTFLKNRYGPLVDLFQADKDASDDIDSVAISVGNLASKLQTLEESALDFMQLVEHTFDMGSPYLSAGLDTLFADPNEIYFCPGYSAEFDDLKRDLDTNNAAIQSIHADLSESIKGGRLLFTPSQGYVIRAPKSCYARISSNPDIIVLDNKTNYIKFTTEELKSYSAQRMEAYNAYFSLQSEVEPEIARQFSPFNRVLDQIGMLLAEIDCLASHAVVSAGTLGDTDNTMTFSWVRPTMNTNDTFRLVGCRNPVLMDSIGAQSTVANDVDFTSKILLLTGPNAGGKTTLLRSIGYAVILAHIGCFVPCTAADIPIRRRLSIRLGTGDCLSKGYSTLMYEMVNMSHIISSLTTDSLVLIDELGRGTSTADGFGLARGVIEVLLAQPSCLALVSTHILELATSLSASELVRPVYMLSQMENNQLRLLYRMKDGTTDATYGLDIARNAGIPPHIIEEARKIMDLAPKHSFEDSKRGGLSRDYTNLLITLTSTLISYQRGLVDKEELVRVRNHVFREMHPDDT